MRRSLVIACATLLLSAGAILAPVSFSGASIAHAGGIMGTKCTLNGQSGYYDAQGNCDVASSGSQVNSSVSQTTSSEYGTIMQYIMELFAWLVGIAAIALDYAAYYTVVTMGNFVHQLNAIGVVWNVMRNLANIAVIFGFLAIGLNIILGLDLYGWGQKMIPKLLFAAVAINFSLFAAEAVIDIGNLFATEIYAQINGGSIPQLSTLSGSNANASNSFFSTNEGISNAIMRKLGLTSLYPTKNNAVFTGSAPWIVGFLGILLFIITSFVLFSLAVILIFRFVALIFIIMLSPLGVAGLIIPKLSGAAKQWWNQLFSQAFTAPVLFLMLYVALQVILDPNFLAGFCKTSTGTACDASTGWTSWILGSAGIAGFASLLLSFLVAMGLLLAVTVYAKKLSAAGAGAATKLGSMASFGAVAWSGRIVGGGVGHLGNNRWTRAWSAKKEGDSRGVRALRFVSRAGAFTGRQAEKRTYDVRNIGVGKARLGTALGNLAGYGSTGVAAGSRMTAKEAYAKGEEKAKYYGRDMWREQRQEYEEAARERDVVKAKKQLEREGNAGVLSGQSEEALTKMSTKELEEMKGIKQGVDALVTNLSPQQFESLMKSEKLSETEKGRIKEARYKSLDNAINSGIAPDVKKELKSLSKGELEAMPTTMLTNSLVLSQLSDKQRDIINDSKERTTSEKTKVRESSPIGRVEDIFDKTPGAPSVKAAAVASSPEFDQLTVPQIAKLKPSILTQYEVAEKLTTASLIELQEQKKLTPAEMKTIGDHIRWSHVSNKKTHEYVSTGPGAALWA